MQPFLTSDPGSILPSAGQLQFPGTSAFHSVATVKRKKLSTRKTVQNRGFTGVELGQICERCWFTGELCVTQ